MANKLVLLPEQIYRGLTSTDTGEPNLDFTKRELDRIRRQKSDPSRKNIRYNQQLRRYLKLRKDREDRPVKVELDKGARILLRKGDEEVEDTVIENERRQSTYEQEWMDDDPRIPIEDEQFESLSPSPLPSLPPSPHLIPPLEETAPPLDSVEVFHQGRDEETPRFPPRKWPILHTPNINSSLEMSKKSKIVAKKKKNEKSGPVALRPHPSTIRHNQSIRQELAPTSTMLALPPYQSATPPTTSMALPQPEPMDQAVIPSSSSNTVKEHLGISVKSKAVAKKKKNTKTGPVAFRPSIIRTNQSIRRELPPTSTMLSLPHYQSATPPESMDQSALPYTSAQLALPAPRPRTSMEIYGRPGVKYRRDPELMEVVSSAVRRETRKRRPAEELSVPGKEKKTRKEAPIRRQWARRQPTQEEALNYRSPINDRRFAPYNRPNLSIVPRRNSSHNAMQVFRTLS